jgi:flagellar protein FliS
MLNVDSPFAARTSGPASRSLAGAYAQIRAQTGIIGADAHKLIEMLFDGLHDRLQEARGAMLRTDVESKCAALSRAARIVEEGLNAGLDTESGLEIADNLRTLYDYLGMLITKANLRSDVSLVEEALTLVTPLRDAWKAIAPTQRMPS